MTSVSNVAHIKIDFFQYWENVANFSQFKRSFKKNKKSWSRLGGYIFRIIMGSVNFNVEGIVILFNFLDSGT